MSVEQDTGTASLAPSLVPSPSHTVGAIKSQAQVRGHRRFLSMLVLEIWPVLALCMVIEGLAWWVGETMPMDAVAEWQSAGADRMWRGGDGRSYLTYKVARVRLLRPDVVALGNSRMDFFDFTGRFGSYTFYDAGLTAFTFDQYTRFLQLITSPGYAPKVLIVNLEYWMFARSFDAQWGVRFYEKPTSHWEDLRIVADKLLSDPVRLFERLPFAGDHLMGLDAVINGAGFRPNGTLDGGPLSPDPNRLLHDGLTVGSTPFVLEDHIDPGQIAKFERFVAFAKTKGMIVIGLQVPFYQKILQELNQNERAGIWREFRSEAIRSYFAKEGVIFFDFADMPQYRDEPEDFVDSGHPARPIVRHIIDLISADPRVQAAVRNAKASP